ncbi:hypothetical protein C8R44DRAFT_769114 [Mycena epipterygia]|nr:hypothetical protein C8R44DRAFT_769114 [Mycena epipterygia]
MPSPGHLALVTGLVSSSYFTFANIGVAYFGVMPATARGNTTLPVRERLTLWSYFYDVAKLHMASAGFISAVALTVPAYLTPKSALRNVLAAGALAAYSSAAFTIGFMLPVNNGLLATRRATAGQAMEPWEEHHTLEQLDKWRAMNRVRIGLGVVSWLASTVAVLASEPMVEL